MPTPKWKRIIRRRLAPVLPAVRPALLITSIVGAIGFIALWLCFQHRPTWYQPVRLDEADMKRVRRESAATVDNVGDKIVRQERFEVVLTDREVTEWLTALPRVWPAARSWWPPELSDPAVHFEHNRVFVGAIFDLAGWRAILNLELSISVSADGRAVVHALVGARGGSLSVPRGVLKRIFAPYLGQESRPGDRKNNHPRRTISKLQDVEGVRHLFDGVRVRNRFVWPNGDRLFRIDSISIENGLIRLGIEPL